MAERMPESLPLGPPSGSLVPGASAWPNASKWQLLQAIWPLADRRGSWNNRSPTATAAGSMGVAVSACLSGPVATRVPSERSTPGSAAEGCAVSDAMVPSTACTVWSVAALALLPLLLALLPLLPSPPPQAVRVNAASKLVQKARRG